MSVNTEYIIFTNNNITITKDTICIKDFDLSVPGKKLFEKASLMISSKNIYGLLGKNGLGKSTLLKQLSSVRNDSHSSAIEIKTLYVEQEILLDNRNPIEYVLDSNYKYMEQKNKLDNVNAILESIEADKMTIEHFEFLHTQAFELNLLISNWNQGNEISKVTNILYGLGFSETDLLKESNLFSGGWQMRISLARSLYLEPELLLLDEPTNHLDLEAIIWLSNYLCTWKKTVIIVSHNVGFLNEVCNYMLNIEDKKLVEYKGNYYLFKKQFYGMQEKKEKDWRDYDKKVKDLQKKKNDKKKVDAFIEKNKVPRPEKPYDVTINFGNPALIRSNIIELSDVTFGYSLEKILLNNISFGLAMESKIALVGANGCGKSTIIKLITKEIDSIDGLVNINSQSKIGYYNQHFENQLPIDKSPIEYLLELIPDDYIKNGMKEQTVREYLGTVKLEPSAHHKKIGALSGGQKARVAFIKIIFQKPHFLVLDEPTNHLDIETVDALIDGLSRFEGGILVITHDSELIKRLNCEIWMLSNATINYKIESFDDYKKLF